MAVSEHRWICEQCGAGFDREKSGSRPIRFCTIRCYHDWRKANDVRAGQFIKGATPWNKGKKGIHLSPETEFKKGRKSENWLPLGSVTIRNDKNGTKRAWVKTEEPNTWVLRAVVNWETFYGRKVPKGKVVHHKDHDALNDAPANLQALSRAQHIEAHRGDLHEAKRQKRAA